MRGIVLEEQEARDMVFADPRCPIEVVHLRDLSLANNFLTWTMYALAQLDTNLGQEFVREAIRFNPSMLKGNPCKLLEEIVHFSIRDESKDQEKLITMILDQMPPELACLSDQRDWATARSYLLKGTRMIMWGRNDLGQDYFTRADELGAKIDEPFLWQLVAQLLNFEDEFGTAAVEEFFSKISPYIKRLGDRSKIQWLKSCYLFNQGLRYYQREEYSKVPMTVIHAMRINPEYITNRGAQAILIRSLVKRSNLLRQ